MFNNIPEVKLGMIAVSRDCFVISSSEIRRKKIAEECGNIGISIYEAPTVVETERDALKAVEEIKNAGCNALVVFLGNFGPETPETIIAQHFDGPVMFIAAAEERGDNLLNGRGDAYCGMLNCSYNLNLRKIKAYIPDYPVGDARECAIMIKDFIPVARGILGIKGLKIITFGPRPQDFFACNAPIKALYDLGVEIEENSELDLLVSYHQHKNDKRIKDVVSDMEKELGKGNSYPDLLERMAQFELTLLDWAESHKGARDYVVFADKCWPAFPEQFGFEPCYVNSRLASRGIPVACEVDIYGAFSEYIGTCISGEPVTLLDINNTVPRDMFENSIKGRYEGDIKAGEITFFRIHSNADTSIQAYICHGEVLPVPTKSFGGIGVFAIPEMGRFYRHVLIGKHYPHHGAVAFSHIGKPLFAVLSYFGITDISFNQPRGMLYKGECPF